MTTKHTFTALRANERTTGALMADPQIVGDLLLVGLWLSRAVHLKEPAPGEGGWSMQDMAADLFPSRTPLPVASFNGVPDRHDPDLNLWRIREVTKKDIRRYDPWADLPAGRPKTTPCAGPTVRKPVCGKPAYTWSMFTDPATGRRRMLGSCRKHIDWYWQERDANRAACEAVEVPRPAANTGGNLARHIAAIDWPALWGALDPEWTCPPEVDSWFRPKLKLLTGSLDAQPIGKPRGSPSEIRRHQRRDVTRVGAGAVVTSWPTAMMVGHRAFFAARQWRARTGRRRANYKPVLPAPILPLACGNGTVDRVGMPGRRKPWAAE